MKMHNYSDKNALGGHRLACLIVTITTSLMYISEILKLPNKRQKLHILIICQKSHLAYKANFPIYPTKLGI